ISTIRPLASANLVARRNSSFLGFSPNTSSQALQSGNQKSGRYQVPSRSYPSRSYSKRKPALLRKTAHLASVRDLNSTPSYSVGMTLGFFSMCPRLRPRPFPADSQFAVVLLDIRHVPP